MGSVVNTLIEKKKVVKNKYLGVIGFSLEEGCEGFCLSFFIR